MSRNQVSRRSLREFVATASGVVANAGVAFLVTWMVGRGLGAEGAGYFFLLTSVFLITTAAVGMGADTGLMRALSRSRALGDPGADRAQLAAGALPVLVLGVVVTTVVVALADDIAGLLGLRSTDVHTLRMLALFLVPATLTAVLLGGCRGLGRIHAYTAVQNLTVPLLRCLGVAVILLVAPDVSTATAAWVAPLGLSVLLAWALLRRQLAPGPWQLDTARAVEFWRFSLPRGLAVLVERAIEWTDVLLVIYLLGPAAGGVYGVVSRCAMAGQFLESAMRIVVGPRISAAVAVEDHAGVRRLFDLATRVLVLALWPFYLVLGIFSSRLLSLFGEEFSAGAAALSVVCLAMLCAAGAGMLQTFLLMAGRSHWQLMNRSVQLGVIAVLTVVLVPRLGLLGAGLAWACGLLADTTLAMMQVSRVLGARSRIRNVAPAAALPLVVLGLGGLTARSLTADSSLLAVAAAVLALGSVYVAGVYTLRRRLGVPLPAPRRSRKELVP